MTKHLFVTNDFPPKLGGIQTMLWELWRRLDPDSFAVLTTPHGDAAAWDRDQPFRVERTRQRVLFPTPALVRRIDQLAEEVDADLVVLDPALPLGLVGPRLERPYAIVVHGAEVTVPRRLPGPRTLLAKTLRGAELVICAGGYPRDEAERAAGRSLPTALIPPGVDTDRFRPLDETERKAARDDFGLPLDGRLVVSVSRLVPRKGMDVLIRSAALLAPTRPDLVVAIGGGGRDERRLQRLIDRTSARSGSSAASLTTTCRGSTAVPTHSPCSAAIGGRASNRRVSASCSWRRRPPECHRWLASAAARPKP